MHAGECEDLASQAPAPGGRCRTGPWKQGVKGQKMPWRCRLTTEEPLLPTPSLARPGVASASLRARRLAAARAGDVSLASMLSARASSASSSST